MKKVILFDIDYTLINTDINRILVEEKLIKTIGCNKKDFKLSENRYLKTIKSSTDFNPDEYCKHLSKYFKINKQPLSDIFYKDCFVYKKSLYRDTLITLQKLQKDFNLGIFSEGFIKFQMAKVGLSEILPFFQKNLIFIFRRKLTKESLARPPKNCIVIDDNLKVIDKLLKITNITPVWINRANKNIHPSTKTVFNLKTVHFTL